MLKYKITQDNTNSSNNAISVKKVEIMDICSSEFENQLLMQCQYGNNEHITANMKIFASNEITLTSNESAYNTNKTFTFNENLVVSGVNENYNTFTCFISKYNTLEVTTFSLQTIDEVKYLYLYFKEGHFFEKETFNGDTNEKIYIFFKFSNNGEIKIVPIKFDYITNTILRCTYESITNEDNLSTIIDWITNEKEYSFNEVKTDDLTELIKVLFPNGGYTQSLVVGDTSNVEVMRLQFLYNNDEKEGEETYVVTTTLKYDVPLYTIPLSLASSSQIDVDKEMNIKEYFVDNEINKAINKITDMEKDVYIPVIWDNKNNKESDYKVYELRFNLHFRKHTLDDDWTTTNDDFWNGNYTEDGKAKLMDKVSEGSTKYGFFSKDASSQADLLSYLGFTDKDVKYQKNKLKKSFLRLSFYDSTNQANQNLLAYYTIFYNIGDAYAKFMRHYSDEDYQYSVLDNDSYENKTKLTGIRVNREPYNFVSQKNEISYDADDVRLAAQFSVKDKYNADSCSEGFYLYLWRDNDNGVMPTDIYMKVEFNHAGYGRSIPFMMPFYDTNKHKGGTASIKSFENIIKDFNGNGDDNPYGIRQYLKYSYIHLKYRYDKDNLRHVYYLDEDTYGKYYNNSSVYDKDGVLSFNLYEAKINTNKD